MCMSHAHHTCRHRISNVVCETDANNPTHTKIYSNQLKWNEKWMKRERERREERGQRTEEGGGRIKERRDMREERREQRGESRKERGEEGRERGEKEKIGDKPKRENLIELKTSKSNGFVGFWTQRACGFIQLIYKQRHLNSLKIGQCALCLFACRCYLASVWVVRVYCQILLFSGEMNSCCVFM